MGLTKTVYRKVPIYKILPPRPLPARDNHGKFSWAQIILSNPKLARRLQCQQLKSILYLPSCGFIQATLLPRITSTLYLER